MRNFDNWNAYTVEGQPFHGRFTFYKLHTTQKVTITDESGTPLDNPILSDTYGRTSTQVFLPDEDVTVFMEKYIGGGNMSDNPDNISAWSVARTFDNLDQTYHPNLDSTEEVAVVGTTEALQEFDNYDKEYVMVLGYYTIGDMPPVFYHLEVNSITTPDGGSVLRPDPTHIWRLITPQILDIRVFGIFPSQTAADAQGYDSQFRFAFSFANSKGISIYMPKVYGRGFYAFNGGDHIIANTLYLDNGVVLSAKTGTINTLNVGKVEGAAAGFLEYNMFNSGSLSMTVKSARSSWLADWNQSQVSLQATYELIIDTQINRTPFSIGNLQHVYIEQEGFNPQSRITFSNIVNFESPGRIAMTANVGFAHMAEIKDAWWALTPSNHRLDLASVDVGATCTMYIDDFQYVENFVILSYANGVKTFNLNGRVYDANVIDRFDNCTFFNGEVSNIHLTGTVTLRNIKGSVYTSPLFAWTDVSIEDCYISGSLPHNISGNVYVKSSSFSSPYALGSSFPAFHGSSCVIRDSIFNGYTVQVPYNAVITGCTFDKNSLGADSGITAYSSTLNGYLSITFSDNVLNAAKLFIAQSSGQTLITVHDSVFVGNSITDSKDGTNFIKWASGTMADSGHTYSYRNNDGPNVLQQESYTTVLKNVPTWFNDGTTPPSSLYIDYTAPIRVGGAAGMQVVTGYTTIDLGNGGVISVPTYGRTEDIDVFARQSRLVGLTIADFNIFCFSINDFVSKYISISVNVQKRDGQDYKKILSPGISANSVGIPANLSLPNYSIDNYTATSSSDIPIPDTSEDLVLQISLTDVRIVS